jgi:hypothetical protein
MDYIGLTFMALTGVGLVGAWVGWSGGSTSPRADVRPAKPAVNGWTGKPTKSSVFGHLADRWTSEDGTFPLPRVQRRGFGVHLAQTPVRRRTWSAYAYPGMWSELHR